MNAELKEELWLVFLNFDKNNYMKAMLKIIIKNFIK